MSLYPNLAESIFQPMADRDNNDGRYVLNTWHILPHTLNELNPLIRFLTVNLKINLELNSAEPNNSESALYSMQSRNLTSKEASDHIKSSGIDDSRVTCDHLVQSTLPMFRFVRA